MQSRQRNKNNLVRCGWVTNDPLYIQYHDEEWGVPDYDDRTLFEFLVLEGAQAGLSWLTVLKRREGYIRAFDQFSVEKVANYGEADIKRLLADDGVIRNKLKIHSAVQNAQVFIDIQNQFGSFSSYLWRHVDYQPIVNNFSRLEDVPAKSELSDRISADLKKRGMNFVGSTIVYAYLQAVGVVNDHIKSCFKSV